jgi:hypothetical protein
VAEHAGLGYSTTTPKLRAWEASGQAERVRTDDGHTLWRLTPAGRAATAAPAGTAGDQQHPESGPIDLDNPRDRDGEPGTADGPAPATPAAEPVTATGDLPPDPVTAAIPAGAIDRAVGGTPDPEAAATVQTTAGDPDAAHGTEPDATADADEVQGPAPGDAPPAQSGAEPGPADGDGAHAGAGGADARPAAGLAGRRTAGSLRGAILDVLQDHPGQPYKISELCRLIDAANTGTDAKKASAGAVHNAAMKLVQTGAAVLVVEKPATFTLADNPA